MAQTLQETSFVTVSENDGIIHVLRRPKEESEDEAKVVVEGLNRNVRRALSRIGPKQKTDLWIELRHGACTGSTIYTIMQGGTEARKLMLEKLGVQKRVFSSMTRWIMDEGNRKEPLALRAYEKASGYSCVPIDFGLQSHKKYDFLKASPDGITRCGRLLEIKAPYSRVIIEGQCPFYYYTQIQALLEVFDLEKADYFEWKEERGMLEDEWFNLVEIARDRDFFSTRILPAISQFTQNMRSIKAQASNDKEETMRLVKQLEFPCHLKEGEKKKKRQYTRRAKKRKRRVLDLE